MDNVLISKHPLVKHKLSKLRDTETQPKKFRELIKEIAGLLTYEATSDLLVKDIKVQTPLSEAEGVDLIEKIGLVPILRSGLG